VWEQEKKIVRGRERERERGERRNIEGEGREEEYNKIKTRGLAKITKTRN